MRLNESNELISSFNIGACSNTCLSAVPVRGTLTVLSGSKGTGKHASMIIECYINAKRVLDGLNIGDQKRAKRKLDTQGIKYGIVDDDRIPATMVVDLVETDTGIEVNVETSQVYDLLKTGDIHNITVLKNTDWNDATGKHTRTFDLNRDKEAAFWRAVEKFKWKISEGRYVYRYAGGALGWLSSLPGTRGINCADFVIKVLHEMGVSKIHYGLFDTAYRVAKAKTR
jgi:hypothetical protein